jgi:hypothetical protein
MKSQALTAGAIIACLLTAAPILAKDKAQKGKSAKANAGEAAKPEDAPAAPQLYAAAAVPAQVKLNAQPSHPAKIAQDNEPWVSVNVRIGDPEREVIRTYVASQNPPSKKGKALPPGLAKKVARGGSLPPGWQKKCVRGEIMPPEVYRQCHPLPQEVVVKLPPPPPGTILVTVHGKIVRLIKASHEILDVFDVI